ncbi:MAG: hypothetical protein J0M00_23930 [Burkholderiales bacterium]|nr:hypothetical protein [Burkholderiales bacterium]
MTAQVSDLIRFEGRWRPLACEPLAAWLRRRGNRHLRFRTMHTGCRRGYRATWEVERGRLFLGSFSARLANGRFAGPTTLFESCSDQYLADSGVEGPSNRGLGCFAFWFSGTLRCPLGPLLHYRHMGYSSQYAAWLELVFEGGLLTGQRVIDGRTAFDESSEADES